MKECKYGKYCIYLMNKEEFSEKLNNSSNKNNIGDFPIIREEINNFFVYADNIDIKDLKNFLIPRMPGEFTPEPGIFYDPFPDSGVRMCLKNIELFERQFKNYINNPN